MGATLRRALQRHLSAGATRTLRTSSPAAAVPVGEFGFQVEVVAYSANREEVTRCPTHHVSRGAELVATVEATAVERQF